MSNYDEDNDYDDEVYDDEETKSSKRTGFCGVFEEIKKRPARRLFN